MGKEGRLLGARLHEKKTLRSTSSHYDRRTEIGALKGLCGEPRRRADHSSSEFAGASLPPPDPPECEQEPARAATRQSSTAQLRDLGGDYRILDGHMLLRRMTENQPPLPRGDRPAGRSIRRVLVFDFAFIG